MRRAIVTILVCLILILSGFADAKPLKKKVKQPSKEMQEYIKQIPLLKESVKEPQGLLSRAKEAEVEAGRLGDELTASLYPRKIKKATHPKPSLSSQELEVKASEFAIKLKSARDGLTVARNRYAAFKGKYGPVRSYYIQKTRESTLVGRTKKDMQWLADKSKTIKKGIDDHAKKIAHLMEMEKKIQQAFLTQGLTYHEPEPKPDPSREPGVTRSQQ